MFEAKTASSCTKPGGYVELCEHGITCHSDNGSMKDDYPIKIFVDLLCEYLVKNGLCTARARVYEGIIQEGRVRGY